MKSANAARSSPHFGGYEESLKDLAPRIKFSDPTKSSPPEGVRITAIQI
jgi:hypothetical protein